MNVLLLIGSPKPRKSTSASLGNYLLERLKEKGWESREAHAIAALKNEQSSAGFLQSVNQSDCLVLAFPLYIDSLPAPLLHALERIALSRAAGARKTRLVVLCNCGFPEESHIRTAMAICRRFADEAGFEWAGGLALGMGGSIDGRALKQAGGMVRNAVKALDLAANALVQGRPVPDEAAALMAKPMMPRWLYLLGGNHGWKRQAKRYGAKGRLYDRPYGT